MQTQLIVRKNKNSRYNKGIDHFRVTKMTPTLKTRPGEKPWPRFKTEACSISESSVHGDETVTSL